MRYDPRDLAEIRVYYQDRFLCRAICQDIAPMQVSLKEIQKARWGIKKELYQQVKKASQLIRNIELERLSKQSSETKAKPKAAMEEPITLKRYEND